MILFRVWDSESEKMFNNVSVLDKLHYKSLYGYCDDKILLIKCNEHITAVVNNEYEHLMSFTGLEDKNGKPIFEGDIIKTFWKKCGVVQYDYETIGIIIYCKESLSFSIHTELYSGPLISHDDDFLQKDVIEIIGNIYENPEMKKRFLYVS